MLISLQYGLEALRPRSHIRKRGSNAEYEGASVNSVQKRRDSFPPLSFCLLPTHDTDANDQQLLVELPDLAHVCANEIVRESLTCPTLTGADKKRVRLEDGDHLLIRCPGLKIAIRLADLDYQMRLLLIRHVDANRLDLAIAYLAKHRSFEIRLYLQSFLI